MHYKYHLNKFLFFYIYFVKVNYGNPQFISRKLESQKIIEQPLTIESPLKITKMTPKINNNNNININPKSDKIQFEEMEILEKIKANFLKNDGKQSLKITMLSLNIICVILLKINDLNKVNNYFNIDSNGYLYFFILNTLNNILILQGYLSNYKIFSLIFPLIIIYYNNPEIFQTKTSNISDMNFVSNGSIYFLCGIYTYISSNISNIKLNDLSGKSKIKVKKEKEIIGKLLEQNYQLAV
jgi:hypothetical protein